MRKVPPIAASSPSYGAAVPVFNVLQTVPSSCSHRVVTGTLTLAATGLNPASVAVDIEDGVAAGTYTSVALGSAAVTLTLVPVVAFQFVVPAGRRYRFTRGAAVAVTETVSTYNYVDVG